MIEKNKINSILMHKNKIAAFFIMFFLVGGIATSNAIVINPNDNYLHIEQYHGFTGLIGCHGVLNLYFYDNNGNLLKNWTNSNMKFDKADVQIPKGTVKIEMRTYKIYSYLGSNVFHAMAGASLPLKSNNIVVNQDGVNFNGKLHPFLPPNANNI
jgi:hypothetical protein